MPTPIQVLLDPVSLAILGLFATMIVIEAIFPARKLPAVKGWRFRALVMFTAYFFLSAYLPMIWDPLLAPYQLFDLSGLGLLGGSAVGILVFEFGVYVWHRAMHGNRFLWLGFHQLHHSAERVDTFGAFYFSPLDSIGFAFVGSLGLTLLVGIEQQAITVTLLATTFLALFQHTNIRTPRWLGFFLQRPESHSHHHERGVHDKNFSDLPLFDIIFGTFKNPKEFAAENGYWDGASSRIGSMLLFRDVSEPPASGAGQARSGETAVTARFEGDIPAAYDRYLGPVLFDHHAGDLAGRVPVSAGSHLLELAAGTGILTEKLLARLPDGARLEATDLNGDMLTIARQRTGDPDAVTFNTADASALDYPDAEFDAITCQFGVMFFPDKVAAYREARRVLKPGGRYVFNVWGSWATNPFAEIADGVVAPLIGKDEPSFYAVPYSYHDAGTIEADLRAAGFTDIRIDILSRVHSKADLEAFAHGLILGNPVAGQIRRNDGDVEAAIAALTRRFEEEFGPDGDIPMEILVIEAG
ncbi:Methyltransferase type 11 [Maricaulis maris MCS10]|uniref:Methyltransferase type 11 n=1 Tax=Maricaulis maris (strain MCS10) TaxID=394221 RepID=Q0AQB1_MARMM|nr:sterol desaturase family protein [Maricaulis maris]ABI65526.1 Methyltransferase type 11 [Maricaulis maris MCS10]